MTSVQYRRHIWPPPPTQLRSLSTRGAAPPPATRGHLRPHTATLHFGAPQPPQSTTSSLFARARTRAQGPPMGTLQPNKRGAPQRAGARPTPSLLPARWGRPAAARHYNGTTHMARSAAPQPVSEGGLKMAHPSASAIIEAHGLPARTRAHSAPSSKQGRISGPRRGTPSQWPTSAPSRATRRQPSHQGRLNAPHAGPRGCSAGHAIPARAAARWLTCAATTTRTQSRPAEWGRTAPVSSAMCLDSSRDSRAGPAVRTLTSPLWGLGHASISCLAYGGRRTHARNAPSSCIGTMSCAWDAP